MDQEDLMAIYKEIPICSDCGEELRQEYVVDENHHGYTSGYCSKCAKHFRLCGKCLYMDVCIKKANHQGDHLTRNGTIFSDSHPGYT